MVQCCVQCCTVYLRPKLMHLSSSSITWTRWESKQFHLSFSSITWISSASESKPMYMDEVRVESSCTCRRSQSVGWSRSQSQCTWNCPRLSDEVIVEAVALVFVLNQLDEVGVKADVLEAVLDHLTTCRRHQSLGRDCSQSSGTCCCPRSLDDDHWTRIWSKQLHLSSSSITWARSKSKQLYFLLSSLTWMRS